MRHAVIDLYLLSQSSHILGPYLSSFVELAWVLGKRRQTLENSVHTFQPGMRVSNHRPVATGYVAPQSTLSLRSPVLVLRDRLRMRTHACATSGLSGSTGG